MYTGILIAVITGLIWTITGVIMSHCSRSKMDYLSYYITNSLTSLFLTMLIYTKWDAMRNMERPVSLSMCMLVAGIATAIGLALMQKAMKSGHNGIIWVIGQSALIIPFLSGVFLFGEPAKLMKFAGVGLILLGMIFPVFLKKRNPSTEKGSDDGTWIGLMVVVFFVLGFGQTFQSIPSYWHGWQDSANIRPSLTCAGCFAGAVIFSFFTGKIPLPSFRIFLFAASRSLINIVSIKLFYVALDRLSKFGMASVGFPLIVGSCIVGFSFYSLLILREKSHWFNWVGLAATLFGLFALCF